MPWERQIMSPHCHVKPFQGCQALQELEKQYPCAVCSLSWLPNASGRSGSNALPGGLYLSRTSLLPLLFNPDFFEDVPIPLLKLFRHSLRGTFLLSRGAASPTAFGFSAGHSQCHLLCSFPIPSPGEEEPLLPGLDPGFTGGSQGWILEEQADPGFTG